MELTWGIIALMVGGGFLAAFIDSSVGGGGLISVPVLLAAGLPPHLALGTNKLSASFSSVTSTITFWRSGKINLRSTGKLVPFTAVGAAGGALLLQLIPSDWLRPAIVVMLIGVTIYTLLKRNWGMEGTYRKLTTTAQLGAIAAAFVLGAYDGFFGPGTGSFLIFIFIMLGYDFVQAAGNAKLLNFTSNVASLIVFLSLGWVDFRLGFLMGAAMVLGSFAGSRLAIRQGTKYVKLLFVFVTVLLIGKQLWTLISGS
ncbi:TSUP family transporter [Paenibacillus sp. OV219]|uniref:TSUP family transporter n=1 Tax=Paenibacillus sp. OV219 TaxID=1884377 RepID=UPI000B838740|nr:TSUP family transporter [Paenibacillus sp. OV219]